MHYVACRGSMRRKTTSLTVLPVLSRRPVACAVNRSSSSKLFLLQNFMNIDEKTMKKFFWFLRLSEGPQKLEHKVDHNVFTV